MATICLRLWRVTLFIHEKHKLSSSSRIIQRLSKESIFYRAYYHKKICFYLAVQSRKELKVFVEKIIRGLIDNGHNVQAEISSYKLTRIYPKK